ncbi:restriction endonuclease [Novilysobacter spongiicola]|uniref:Restriction endonuclease n=1 Tax=Lysobacter spongiicola DSM 21749 TaxID=1122188 RepID=A0A1T4LT09_9GAMM|nr:restriction endonuclease [Lysobacter spongiicola]SJZ57815.1 Restriction endonuclease [Lysobacter spongiicola DSM 21749]
MLNASLAPAALLLIVVAGAAFTAWLWTTWSQRLVVEAGLKTLSAMRWREFSRFVIEALQAQGFEASRVEPDASRGQKADLLLNRGGQIWLLSCKQGTHHRIRPGMVDELAGAVRDSGASGGILATLGKADTDSTTRHAQIEVIDGRTLWPLIDPLLPPSVHNDLLTQARRKTVRTTAMTWVVVVLACLAVAWLASAMAGTEATSLPRVDPAPAPAPVAAPVAPPTAGELSPARPTLTEDQQRQQAAQAVGTLADVVRVQWATSSTLVVYLPGAAGKEHVDAICQVLEQYEDIRNSRIQLQPPEESGIPVRFVQCTAF